MHNPQSRGARALNRLPGILVMASLLLGMPVHAQNASADCPPLTCRRLPVGSSGTLHVVLRDRITPDDVLRVYGPDGELLGKEAASGVQDLLLDVPAPVGGTYSVRDERPGISRYDRPIALDVHVEGRAPAAESLAQAPTDTDADTSIDEQGTPFDVMNYAPSGTPTLSLANLDPAPGTMLRRPACDLMDAVGDTHPCPPGRTSLGADVIADFVPGQLLVLIALLDRDEVSAVPAANPDGGVLSLDEFTAIAYVKQPGTVHLSTSTTALYLDSVPHTTRLRVRLCEFPHTINGVFQLGPCHAEVASGTYPVAPGPAGRALTPTPVR